MDSYRKRPSVSDARRFLMLMPQWSDQLDQFLLYDDSKQLRDLFVDAPRPFLDDRQRLVCPMCPKGFESKLDFNLHVSLHEFGHCHIADCCLGSSLSRAVHKHHDSLGAGLKGISFGDRPSLLGSLTSIWDAARRADPDRTSGLDKDGFHEWTLVVQIVRYSFVLTGRLLTDSRSPTSPHMPAFAQSMREHSILLWVNLPESHFLGLADQVGILGTISLEVIGF